MTEAWLPDAVLDARQLVAIHAGVDRVELDDFARILSIGGDEFVRSVYTDHERGCCQDRIDRLADRFAAKEAASKALGTGLRGIAPREIEVFSEPNGRPRLRLRGRAQERAQALGIISTSVSLSHTSRTAEAFVVALAVDTSTTGLPLRKESTL